MLARALGNLGDGLRPAVQLDCASAGQPQGIEDTPCSDRTDTIEELQQAKPADLVCRVIGESHQRYQVLDVGCVQIAQAAILDERDRAPGQFELEQVGVV